MPRLRRLFIVEPEEEQLTAAEATPLNAALLARCPRLTAKSFTQTLRSDGAAGSDSKDDGEEEERGYCAAPRPTIACERDHADRRACMCAHFPALSSLRFPALTCALALPASYLWSDCA